MVYSLGSFACLLETSLMFCKFSSFSAKGPKPDQEPVLPCTAK